MRKWLFFFSFCFGFITSNVTASQIWVWGGDGSITNVPVGLTNIVAISAGFSHAVALTSDGKVVSWGDNSYNQTAVPLDLSNVVAIAAGGYHSLALLGNGTVRGWGNNLNGESTPPAGLTNVLAISADNGYSEALKADGTVTAWGSDSPFGETVVPPGLAGVIAVSAGGVHSLALLADGTVVGWGNLWVPGGLSNIVAVSAGGDFSLVLDAHGSVSIWGPGNGCGFPSVPPGLANVVAISAGNTSSLALRNDGTVVAWGCGSVAPPAGLSGVTAVCVSKGACYFALADVAQPIVPVTISFIGPSSQTVAEGSQAFFSVSASGPPPLTYQWYVGSNAILGATNWWLNLTNVQFTQAGSYTVKVSNLQTSATSQAVVLNVAPSLDVFLVPAISLGGAVGSKLRIDYMTGLGPTNAWTSLTTITLTNVQQFYSDYSAIGQPARIYRVVQVP